MEALFLDARVGKIQYRRGGSGPALVYLHSATGEGEGLELLDLLAARFDVIAPMFPGFGESDGLDQIDDMEDATFHLLDVLERLDIERPILVGASLGGWMAAEVATRYPERVDRLVLVNPAGLYIPGAEIKDIFGRKLADMIPDLYYDDQHPMAAADAPVRGAGRRPRGGAAVRAGEAVPPDHGCHRPPGLGPVPAQPQAPQAAVAHQRADAGGAGHGRHPDPAGPRPRLCGRDPRRHLRRARPGRAHGDDRAARGRGRRHRRPSPRRDPSRTSSG